MQQARVVKREESRDVGALMLLLLRVPTRIVAMIAQVVFAPSICTGITGTMYAWKSQMQAAAWPAQSREPFTKRVTTFPRNASKLSLHVHHLL